MPANVTEWDARYLQAAKSRPRNPPALYAEWLPLLPTGRRWTLPAALDGILCCSLRTGQCVTAVDWSGAALDILEIAGARGKLDVSRALAETIRERNGGATAITLIQVES